MPPLPRLFTQLGHYSGYLLALFFLFIRLGVVAAGLSIILDGIYHLPLSHVQPSVLTFTYLLLVGVQVGKAAWAGRDEQAWVLLARMNGGSTRFFWANGLGLATWLLLVMTLREPWAEWFAMVWAVAALGGLVWLNWRGVRPPAQA